jgi:phosphohistidine phosphatase SixA
MADYQEYGTMIDASSFATASDEYVAFADDPERILSSSWVRAVQTARGQIPCYRTDGRFGCSVPDCEWRHSCLKLIAEWRR